MKIGDKLICKKRFNKSEKWFCQFQKDDSAFEMNKAYEIIYVSKIGPTNTDDGKIISIKCGFLVNSVHGIHEENTIFITKMYPGNERGRNTPPYLYDYFYSTKEMRKLKLKKLNGIKNCEK